ncbi:MAG: hypothetical protein Q8O82_15240 [Pseudorhodobacter sp.]|nr:hypothetical protein [Pseudorhodobacter sp.]
MTLTAEMSRITRAMGESYTRRSHEIDEMQHALERQIKEGRASAKRASSTLHDSIEHDLKNISRHVAATRSAASGLIRRYKAGRQASTKVLKARLEVDRAALTAMVKKVMQGLEQDRVGAGRVFRDYAASRQPKVKQSAAVFTRAPVVSPAAEAGKTASVSASVVAASAMGGAPQK